METLCDELIVYCSGDVVDVVWLILRWVKHFAHVVDVVWLILRWVKHFAHCKDAATIIIL